jgi:hypothetical protein
VKKLKKTGAKRVNLSLVNPGMKTLLAHGSIHRPKLLFIEGREKKSDLDQKK